MRGLAVVVKRFGPHPANPGQRATDNSKNVGNHDGVGVAREAKSAFGPPLTRYKATPAQVRENCPKELGRKILLLG
jgi:hypothetical protein